MNNLFKQRGLLTFILSTALLFLFYQKLILNINSCYFSASGDGLKNYYSTIYQVKFGTNFWFFEGMNYPYGENLVFTDAQPTIVFLLKIITVIFPFTKNYLLGILNFLMIISIPLTAVCIQKILAKYLTNIYTQILPAIIIAFLSPQIERLGGHYALSYSFIIPLFYLFVIQHLRDPKPLRSAFIGLCLIIAAFIHLYYLLIIGLFIVCIHFIDYLKAKNIKSSLAHLFLQFIFPFIISFMILKWFDPITDRPSSPYGFLAYRAHWEGILISLDSPLIIWMKDKFLPIRNVDFEGRAYLGFFSTIILLVGLFYALKRKSIALQLPKEQKSILIGTLILTAFSLGIPFIYGLDFLIKYLGPLQQFRSIGRFAWPLFFVLNVHIIIITKNYFDQIIKKKILVSILALASLVTCWEIYRKNTQISNTITNIEKNENDSVDSFIAENTGKYEAIIPIPFFHIGSECLYKYSSDELIKKAFFNSMNHGNKLLSTMSSRTSFTQTMNVFDLFTGEKVDSTLNNNKKPYLILVDKKDQKLYQNEKKMIEKGTVLLENENFALLTIARFPTFKTIEPEFTQTIVEELKHEKKLTLKLSPTKGSIQIINFKINRPENRDCFANYKISFTKNSNTTSIEIDGTENILSMNDLYIKYQKEIIIPEYDKIEFEAKLMNKEKAVILQSLFFKNK